MSIQVLLTHSLVIYNLYLFLLNDRQPHNEKISFRIATDYYFCSIWSIDRTTKPY